MQARSRAGCGLARAAPAAGSCGFFYCSSERAREAGGLGDPTPGMWRRSQRAVLAECLAAQRHGAVLGEGVGVDEHPRLAIQAALAVDLRTQCGRSGQQVGASKQRFAGAMSRPVCKPGCMLPRVSAGRAGQGHWAGGHQGAAAGPQQAQAGRGARAVLSCHPGREGVSGPPRSPHTGSAARCCGCSSSGCPFCMECRTSRSHTCSQGRAARGGCQCPGNRCPRPPRRPASSGQAAAAWTPQDGRQGGLGV